MKQDLEHLRLLSIFHYVVAGLTALFACFPMIHLVIGLLMIFMPDKMISNGEPPPAFSGWLFVVLAASFILIGWAYAICLAVAGRYLSQHKHYNYCLVMACVACLFMPFGTVLGIFTIIVLMRPSVKELFGLPTQNNIESQGAKVEWYHETWFLILALTLFFPLGLILLWTRRDFHLAIKVVGTFIDLCFVIFPISCLSVAVVLLSKYNLMPLHPLPILVRSFCIPLAVVLLTFAAFKFDWRERLKNSLTVLSILLILGGGVCFFINTPAYHSAIGISCYEIGKEYSKPEIYDKTIPHLSRAIELNPNCSTPYYTLGKVYKRQKKYDRAIGLLKKFIELKPDDPYGYDWLADCYLGKKLYDQAFELYKKAIEVGKDQKLAISRGHYGSGYVLKKRKMYDEAIREFKKALELDPTESDSYLMLGNIYSEKEMYDEAIREYKTAIQLESNNSKAHYGLGVIYSHKGLYDRAIRKYKTAIQLESNNSLAHYGLGVIYSRKGLYDRAIRKYGRAIELDPNDGLYYYGLGYCYSGKKMLEEAIREYEKAVSLSGHKSRDSAQYNIGSAYYDLGEYDKALEAYQKTLAMNPDYANFYGYMGHVYHDIGDVYYQKEEYDKALEGYRKTLAISPDHADAYTHIGCVYYYGKRMPAEAVKWYQKALEIDPEDDFAIWHLGFLYEETNRQEEAITQYNKAINLGTETEWTKQAREHLEKLQKRSGSK